MKVAIPETPNERTVFFSGVGSISLDNVFDGKGADTYRITAQVYCSADPGGSIVMVLRSGGVDNRSAVYYGLYKAAVATGWATVGTPDATGAFNAITDWIIGFRQWNFLSLLVTKPGTPSSNKEMVGETMADGSNQILGTVQGRTSVIGAHDGFSIIPSAAVTISGFVKVEKVA